MHNVGYSERSHVPIEPYLSEQWFLKYPQVPRSTDAVEQRRDQVLPRTLDEDLHALDAQPPRLVHQPPTLVGHRIPVWYRKQRSEERRAKRVSHNTPALQHSSTPRLHLRRPHAATRSGKLGSRPRRARHVVQFVALAVCDDGLAGEDRHAEEVLSDDRPRHRPGHHFLLGRADDHGGLRVHGRETVRQRLFHRHHPRRHRPQDEQVARQLARSARPHRQVRRRRPAVRPHAHRAAGPGHSVRRETLRSRPQLHEQALERRAVHPDAA